MMEKTRRAAMAALLGVIAMSGAFVGERAYASLSASLVSLAAAIVILLMVIEWSGMRSAPPEFTLWDESRRRLSEGGCGVPPVPRITDASIERLAWLFDSAGKLSNEFSSIISRSGNNRWDRANFAIHLRDIAAAFRRFSREANREMECVAGASFEMDATQAERLFEIVVRLHFHVAGLAVAAGLPIEAGIAENAEAMQRLRTADYRAVLRSRATPDVIPKA